MTGAMPIRPKHPWAERPTRQDHERWERDGRWPMKRFGYLITDNDLKSDDWARGLKQLEIFDEVDADGNAVDDLALLWEARMAAVARAGRAQLHKRDREMWERAGYPCAFRGRYGLGEDFPAGSS